MDKKNENTSNLTQEQMEKVSGGGNFDSTGGIDLFLNGHTCPGEGCGQALKRISGKLYRCTNPQCPLFALDQFPAGK